MKKYILPLLLIIGIGISCKKDDNKLPYSPTEDNALPSSFVKRVLLEDYTKHCQFCIPVNTKVDSMRNSYSANNRLIPVLIAAFHPTEIPHYGVMQPIFNITVFPVAAINRVPAVNSGSENGKLITKKEYWATNIDAEMQKTTNYGLKLNSSLSGTNIDVTVTIGALEANTDLKLTVYIIEDDAYYRNLTHVLSNSKGDGVSLAANTMVEKTFSTSINGNNLSKSSIVAFVHYFDESTNNFEVVNVQEVKVGEDIGWQTSM